MRRSHAVGGASIQPVAHAPLHAHGRPLAPGVVGMLGAAQLAAREGVDLLLRALPDRVPRLRALPSRVRVLGVGRREPTQAAVELIELPRVSGEHALPDAPRARRDPLVVDDVDALRPEHRVPGEHVLEQHVREGRRLRRPGALKDGEHALRQLGRRDSDLTGRVVRRLGTRQPRVARPRAAQPRPRVDERAHGVRRVGLEVRVQPLDEVEVGRLADRQ